MARILRSTLTVVRWWFGTTYILAAVGSVVAAPVMIERGNYGGVYMVIGGISIGAVGWVIHPRGLKRQGRSATTSRA